ncbi:MAG: type III-B CRISPR module RAMP protein Cmr6 [Chloroflexi bacterium]|nr:type III-B CRISPR module RAMP protein Cmr6 [Chloroflexota bacterium]
MARPLYEASLPKPDQHNPQGHAGLWYDKFCHTWTRTGDRWSMAAGGSDHDQNPKLEWINTVTSRPIGHAQRLAEYASRMVGLVEARGGRWAALTTESRFVTGLGRSHPVENGFAWHPSLGVPFLTGSSVKGMAHAWAKAEGAPSEQVDRIFGDLEHGGRITFLDAVPTLPVQLEADVMTPHYAGWSPEDPPGDWRSPVPVYFLTTAAQSTFLFGILPGKHGDPSDLDAAWGFVDDALAWAGAGAKTAVGYGHFNRDATETNRLLERISEARRILEEERRRSEANKTPEGRWRLEVEGLSELGVLDLVRTKLGSNGLEDAAERHACAAAIVSIHGEMVSLWGDGKKQAAATNVGSKRLRERAAQVKAALGGDDPT